MSEPFDTALTLVLEFEGGKVDDPVDRGGRTAFGITQATYDRWLSPAPSRDVWTITPEEVGSIYRRDYWNAMRGDQLAALSAKLALCVFDGAVNHGVGTSVKMLQRVVLAVPDGAIGQQTLACVQQQLAAVGEVALLEAYLQRRHALYANLIVREPSQAKYRKGWQKRLNRLAAEVELPPVWEDA